MSEKVKRYCPHCGAKVSGETHIFASPVKCPKCGEGALFVEPREEPDISLNAVDTLLNKNLKPFNVAAILVLLVAIGSIFSGSRGIVIIVALLCLIVAVLAGYLYLNQRAAVSSLKERKDKFDEVLHKYMDLKRNFDAHVRDEELRLATDVEDKISVAKRREQQAAGRMKAVGVLGERFLKDTLKWTMSRLTPNNYAVSKERLLKVVQYCRDAGYPVDDTEEEKLIAGLKTEYEMVLRKDFEKQEQARIKQQIREEQRAQKEVERELARIEAEKKAVESALEEALRKAKGEHSAEVESLRAKLREAEERGQRTKSMAEMTKAGHVYVISNVGSFGEEVFKIGLTRRLEPLDRVKELGDASVPFPFDVHMMIHSDNAPELEATLHREFQSLRINKVNIRKEFFRVDIEAIRKIVKQHHGEVSYEADAEALEYKQSLEMSDEDYKYVTEKVREIEGDARIEED